MLTPLRQRFYRGSCVWNCWMTIHYFRLSDWLLMTPKSLLCHCRKVNAGKHEDVWDKLRVKIHSDKNQSSFPIKQNHTKRDPIVWMLDLFSLVSDKVNHTQVDSNFCILMMVLYYLCISQTSTLYRFQELQSTYVSTKSVMSH